MSRQVTAPERIQELLDISSDVATMLKAAGHAINGLTGRSDKTAHQNDEDNTMQDDSRTTLEAKKEAFDEHTAAYFTHLQAVSARLRRQVYALEEAGIISSESTALGNTRASGEQGRTINGGLGNLDVGWLNSRGNRVGAEKENEIVQEIKDLLQDQTGKEG